MSKKVFIDGGFHLGEGLLEFKEMLSITNDWIVHCFEPNIYCNNKVINDDNITFHRKAIWIEDGVQMFNCEDNNANNSPKLNSISNLDGWGSSLTILENKHTFVEQIIVETINFDSFIKNFKDCEIYCKLDIEGAEFEVLRKLIVTGSISLIKELWVEFHDWVLPNENEKTKFALISELSNYTKINEWK